jgi:hypothetical protein
MKLTIQETIAAPTATDPTTNQNMRPAEAARYTGLSVSTLAKLRMHHNRPNGPGFLKISGCIIYKSWELDRWMNSYSVDMTS